MIRVKFINAHIWKNFKLREIAAKWNGKFILIDKPINAYGYYGNLCKSELQWPILEPELLKEIIKAGGNPNSCVCRHMFEGAD